MDWVIEVRKESRMGGEQVGMEWKRVNVRGEEVAVSRKVFGSREG